MTPEINRRRAVFVLGKIDEILSWEKTQGAGEGSCASSSWENICAKYGRNSTGGWRRLKSFDEFLEKRFPDSRRKAYYLMAIHENLTRVPKHAACERWVGGRRQNWSKVARKDGERFDCATWLHKAKELPKEEFKREVERHLTGKETEAVGDSLLQAVQESAAGGRAGT